MSEGEAPAENEPEKKCSYQEDLTAMKEKTNEKTLARIERERDEMDSMSRFGFFSVPYPATVGDKAYSRKKVYNVKIVEGKVITEKRGIYTQPFKKGKGPDVYFQNIEPVSKQEIEEMKLKNKEEFDKYKQSIKERKENKDVNPKFKPAGPQELKGFYESDEKPPVPDGPLVKEKNKFTRIGPEHRVITEKRGIFTHPTKVGNVLVPNDFFSYPSVDNTFLEELKRRANEEKLQKEKELKKKFEKPPVYKKPFAPASLKKCECFSSIEETYCQYDPETTKKILNEYSEMKKKGKPKFTKILPKGAIKHDRPFAPPRLVSSGREALFNDDLYKIPRIPQEEKKQNISMRERRELENKNRKNPFVYNKLMNNSTFAPPIMSIMKNMKREFPTIFKF